MGEVLVTSGGKVGFEVEEAGVVQPAEKNDEGRITSSGVDSHVGWERFLPKMVVRVLLVEADDSTRQIISALLRKCSYRVSAVPDGLKAWELLKGRPHNVDLILTEVELPSISGYALLTLIMEHQVCKNIPVIMMSSHDSVNTVYKCMLRGAIDFLVKPVRKNELRNLWQHVWRKLASNSGAGLGPPYENITQEKDEATAENNDISNHSSGHMSSIQRNKECIEKGSDAQSSCMKPELEAKREDQEHVQCLSLPKSSKYLSDEIHITGKEEFPRESRKRQVRDDENGELQPVQKMFASFTTKQAAENAQERVQIASKSNHVLEDSSGGSGAIDLIGAFANHQRGGFGSLDPKGGKKEYELMPQLDLSLRRNNPSVSANQVNDERHRLNHSDASPFSRYINKSMQLQNSSRPATCNQKEDHENNSEQQNYTEAHGSMTSPKQVPVILKGHNENRFSYSQNREVSLPIPVRGVRLENLMNACSSAMPSAYHVQPSHTSLPCPGTAHHSESFQQVNTLHTSECKSLTSQQVQCPTDHRRISNSIEQTDDEQGKKFENLEDQGHSSPANDQSTTNSSFCNGNISHIQRAGSGSYGNINAISISKTPSECGNEESFHMHEGSSHRSILREAALTKFRLKRKDRCFEKKVRYESRKKLAEQRPRVKGQFVRQVPDDPQPGSSSSG